MPDDEPSCDALPVRPCIAAVRDDPLELEHRRVRGQEGELAAGRGRARDRGRALRRCSGTTSIAVSSRPPYAKRSPSSAARSPDTIRRSSSGTSGSKSTSQIHDTSRPSAISSLSAITATPSRGPRTSVLHDLIGAGRVLDQQHEQRLPVDTSSRSKRPNAGSNLVQTGGDLVERASDRTRDRRRARARCRRCRGPAAAAARAALPSGVSRSKATLSIPSSSTRACGDVERRPAVAARRARVIAEMTDVRRHVVGTRRHSGDSASSPPRGAEPWPTRARIVDRRT